MRTLSLFFLSLLAALLSSCITEDEANNTPTGNFETCWKLIDEHYCFFDYKNKEYGLDWAAVRERYRQGVTDNMRSEQLFEVLRRMTAELRDGHVNLSAAHDVARYGAWFDDFPISGAAKISAWVADFATACFRTMWATSVVPPSPRLLAVATCKK